MDERNVLMQALLDLEGEGTTVIFYHNLEAVLTLLDEMQEPPSAAAILALRAQQRRDAGAAGDTG
ncbi:MAG: hypothetical protein U0822_17335 [Anaerolineae bacterium]